MLKRLLPAKNEAVLKPQTEIKVNRWVKFWIITIIMTLSSGDILNQLWDQGKKKDEVNITNTPHLAYYKNDRALNKSGAERFLLS